MIVHAGVSIIISYVFRFIKSLSLQRERKKKRLDVSKDRQGIKTNSLFFSMQFSSLPASPVFKNI